MNQLKVASVQFNHAAGDKPANLSIIRKFVEEAYQQQVELVCFPECCVSGYWHLRHLSRDELADLAEEVPQGNTTLQLRDWSQELGMTIGAGLVERDRRVAELARTRDAGLVVLPAGGYSLESPSIAAAGFAAIAAVHAGRRATVA